MEAEFAPKANCAPRHSTLYALKHLGEPVSPCDARPSMVGSGLGERAHWVAYAEDADENL
jgi:hypothetical protein